MCLAGEQLKISSANLKTPTEPLETPASENRSGELPERQPWDHGPLLPMRVQLREFAARGLKAGGKDLLWKYLLAELPAPLADFGEPLRLELLEGGGLLLLDGLDEVPEGDRRRDLIKQAISRFRKTFGNVRILVTSHTYAYQKQSWQLDGLSKAVLASFRPSQIERFVDRWYAHIGRLSPFVGRDTERESDAETLRLKAHQVMVRKVATISLTAPVAAASSMMKEMKLHCLPVVNDDELVGIVTVTDLMVRGRGTESDSGAAQFERD